MTDYVTDSLQLREEFNSIVKPNYRKTHTPQCRKCMRFHKWGNSIMEVHHKQPLIDGGMNDEENLITLCCECHEEWHKREEYISFDDWMQEVPLYVYAAIGLVNDKTLKSKMLSEIDDMWPAIRDRRMVTEPWIDENKEYVKKNSSKWIDW